MLLPKRTTRKFFHGDAVIINNSRKYPLHINHRGIVAGTRIKEVQATGPRVTQTTYTVDCECGERISPQADCMGHADQDFDMALSRMQNFLENIGRTPKGKHPRSLKRRVDSILDSLNDKDRMLTVRRFGLDGTAKAGYREIGKELGVSFQRAHQLGQQGIKRLKNEN